GGGGFSGDARPSAHGARSGRGSLPPPFALPAPAGWMAAEAGRRKRSRCRCALGLALLFDALGLAGVLVGGLLETHVSDLLIYLGGVAAFFSLPWWVFWHVGNLEVPLEELRD
ncbi:Transmembrane protein, partial [Ophiophagus hannah]